MFIFPILQSSLLWPSLSHLTLIDLASMTIHCVVTLTHSEWSKALQCSCSSLDCSYKMPYRWKLLKWRGRIRIYVWSWPCSNDDRLLHLGWRTPWHWRHSDICLENLKYISGCGFGVGRVIVMKPDRSMSHSALDGEIQTIDNVESAYRRMGIFATCWVWGENVECPPARLRKSDGLPSIVSVWKSIILSCQSLEDVTLKW